MAEIEVVVEFQATAKKKFLYHRGKSIKLDKDGKGKTSATLGKDEVIVAEVRRAQPGSEVKITLAVEAPAKVDMVPFEGHVAKNRTVWVSSRYFLVFKP